MQLPMAALYIVALTALLFEDDDLVTSYVAEHLGLRFRPGYVRLAYLNVCPHRPKAARWTKRWSPLQQSLPGTGYRFGLPAKPCIVCR